ncbi:MAG: formate/nitrite transporter family protein [Longimicrobiales bacterium]
MADAPVRHTAHVLFSNVQHAARDELRRSSVGLAFSGFSAGLNIGFSFVAVAAVLTAVGTDSPYAGLWAAVAYPVGFILIILARAQLFTENTLTPVILVLSDPTQRNLLNTARLWGIVLAANLLGAYLFALALSSLDVAPHLDAGTLRHVAEEAYRGGWQDLFLRAIYGGWLIALLTWIIHAGTGVLGELVVIWLIAFMIQAAGFAHSVAGAVEILYLAHEDILSWRQWLLGFQVPVTLGNAVGGVVFVGLVNFGQAVGAGRDAERAERTRHIRELRRAKEIQEAVSPDEPGAAREES